MLRTVICAAILLALQAPPAFGGDAGKTIAARIDAAIAPSFQAGAPGATVIVVKDGKTILRRAYGMADAGKGIAMRPDMVLRLASITKQFTAAAILLLSEEGRLSLDDDITRHLPDYPARGRRITIEHLLTHTSGIASFTSKPAAEGRSRQDMSVAQLIDSFKDDPLDFEPGSEFRYNNSGYVLLGAIIEKVSGTGYADFLAQRIFVPLGMKDTAYEGHARRRAPVAAGHSRTEKGYDYAAPLSMSQPYAAGALVSTVDDLARWDAAISSGSLLKSASWRRAFTSWRLNDGKPTGYGYGWEVGKVQGEAMVGHGGAINGFTGFALRIPERKVYVAVLSNSDSGPANPQLVARKAAAVALGKPYREFREVAPAPGALDAVAGSYDAGDGVRRVFRHAREGLLMQLDGQPPVRLKAASKDRFFVAGGLDWFAFERDARGKVTGVTLHREGEALRNPRIGDAPAGRRAVKIPHAAFDRHVGRYQLRPDLVIEFTREGDRYFGQALGQDRLEIFPMSENVFFSDAADAEIVFEGQGMVLRQGGRSTPGRKL
ncbi:serine hydrolase [Massilia agri]|uniref:Serine hydrolase n=1 Tax=Massilia agri TaxID=1886785 RepID=A0ABT2AIS9_9BURK|nr:serine hydrolase [Massilia agri]MCS0596110.1 serine hydrolase [Massilia agri]